MSRALITEGYLTDIANAIRAKLDVENTYTPPQMAAAIASIPTGGITPTGTKNITQNGTHDVTQYASANVNVQPNLQSKTVTQNGTVTPDQGYDGLSSVAVNVSGGGGTVFLYSMGSFYGDPSAMSTNNLSCQIAGAIGCKALLIVMHRDNITVSGGMELVHKTQTEGYNQWVSIYQKVMTSAAETVTITQASSARMCACSVYVNAGVSLSAPITQEMDNGSSTYRYTIAPRAKPCIAVINHVYADNVVTTILPTHAALPISITNGTAATIRFAVFILQDVNTVVYSSAVEVTDAAKLYNRLFLYEVN